MIIYSIIREVSKTNDAISSGRDIIRYYLWFLKHYSEGEIHVAVGAKLLNFDLNDKYTAYHGHVDTWQRPFGYNAFYDTVFDAGTDMNVKRPTELICHFYRMEGKGISVQSVLLLCNEYKSVGGTHHIQDMGSISGECISILF